MVIRNASGKSGDDSSPLFSRVFQTSRVPHKCVSISLADQEITASQEIASCCAQSTKNCALDSDCSASAILNCSCLSHFATAALASLLILLRDWAFLRRAWFASESYKAETEKGQVDCDNQSWPEFNFVQKAESSQGYAETRPLQKAVTHWLLVLLPRSWHVS